MRATSKLVLSSVVAFALAGCFPKEHPDVDWMKPPKGYDPAKTEGLTLNEAGVNALSMVEGDERSAHVEALSAEGKFKGQAKCQSGAGTGELDHSQWGEYELSCTTEAVWLEVGIKYHLFTTRELGKPLSANAYVDFTGTLVEFRYHDETKPRSITAMVKVDQITRIPQS
jgi:hypothetical protein